MASLPSHRTLFDAAYDYCGCHIEREIEREGITQRLAALRNTLRATMGRSPLTDGRIVARDLEDAFRQIWGGWCDQAQGAPGRAQRRGNDR
jgi:hypothetical protein